MLLLHPVPGAPFELWIRRQRRGIKLHIRRVFVPGIPAVSPVHPVSPRRDRTSADRPRTSPARLLQGKPRVDKPTESTRPKGLRCSPTSPRRSGEVRRSEEFGAVLKERHDRGLGNEDEGSQGAAFTSTASHRTSGRLLADK